MNRIDELNIAGRSMPYEKYFGEMELSDRQKKERMEISEEFEDMMAFLFALLAVMDEYSYDDEKTKTAAKQIESRYLEILSAHMEPDDFLREYAREFARDIVETTIGHIDDPWYLSDDRAVFVAENEANTTYNYADYRQAVGSGKTHKQWITMKDQRVRKTHREVDGETIPIDEVFLVGESLMRYPKDTSLGASAEEIVNCRCTVRYVGNGGKNHNIEALEKSSRNDILISGARITDPDSPEAEAFAEMFYPQIRKRTTDCAKIARNIGESEDDIKKVKNYLFIDNSYFDDDLEQWTQFPPDCAIAQSWQRLTEGKDIKEHDLILIKHELLEMEIKKANPSLTHLEAHRLTEKTYNYTLAQREYYDNLKKH